MRPVARKSSGYFKLDLIALTPKSMEDSGAKDNSNCEGPVPKISKARILVCSLEIILVIF